MGASTPATEIDRAGPATDALLAAVQRSDWPAAQQLLDQFGDAPPQSALRSAAVVHLAQGRYKDAVRLLNRIIDRDDACMMQRRLALNLAALAQRDPRLADLIAHSDSSRYQIIHSKSGHPTLCRCEPDGRRIALSANNDPIDAANRAMTALNSSVKVGSPLGLLGFGDGYVLHSLAHLGPKMDLGYQLLIHVIEPDPALVRAAMLLHDYTGTNGPITQSRFRWWIGDDYQQQLLALCRANPRYLPPTIHINQGVAPQIIAESMARAWQTLQDEDNQLGRQVTAAYSGLTADSLAKLFGPNPPRKPRALVLTTRFSTVLQYSSRDITQSLQSLGFDALLFIETEPWTTNTIPATRRAVLEFKPDIVIQIDHLRHEYTDIFPPQLPFVCWIQDHLPHLINRSTGAQVGNRDFVLTSISPLYSQHYNYPARQLIDICKLTRVPHRPAQWNSDGDDLVYVSNAGQPIDAIIDQAADMVKNDPKAAQIIRQAGQQMQLIYDRGDTLPTMWHVKGVLDEVVAAHAAQNTHAEVLRKLLHLLNHPLNNTLYRQQTLRWTVNVAKHRGLKLALYGNGWDKHPEFSPYARGPVNYGPDLEELTRRSRINLQIVPSYCLHQRMLDGLAAGGFFLVRSLLADRLLPQLAAFIGRHLSPDVQTVAQARATVAATHRAQLDDLLSRGACLQELDGSVDLIQWTRACMRAQLLDNTGLPIPHYDDVAFDNEAALEKLIDCYINNPDARRQIADAQWASIEHRLTYTAGMKRVMNRIAQLLAEEKD